MDADSFGVRKPESAQCRSFAASLREISFSATGKRWSQAEMRRTNFPSTRQGEMSSGLFAPDSGSAGLRCDWQRRVQRRNSCRSVALLEAAPPVGELLILAVDKGSMLRPNLMKSRHSTDQNSLVQSFLMPRRRFLRGAAAATAGIALAPLAGTRAAPRNKALPKPQKSGIEHIVVVMMENRSFDHFVGWIPGANGRQAGLTYLDENGVAHPTMPLAPDYQGCAYADPDHSYEGGRIEFNNGACDGWLRAGDNDLYAIGYYTQADLAFYSGAAQAWTSFDNYFSAIMAGTYPNRIYQHAAQTDRLDNTLTLSSLPTIWDRLADHSLPARYYFSDLPFIALWGTKYLNIARHITGFFADCAAGTLPAVSFVEPRLLGETQGLSNDDHPHADIRNGQDFLNTVYRAVQSKLAEYRVGDQLRRMGWILRSRPAATRAHSAGRRRARQRWPSRISRARLCHLAMVPARDSQ